MKLDRAAESAYQSAVTEIHERAEKERTSLAEREKASQTEAARRAAGEQLKIADYQMQARAAMLETQGRPQEAQLLRFDAEWTKRIAEAKSAEEKAAATAAYQAERAQKIAEAANEPTGPSGRRGGLRGESSPAESSVPPSTIAEAQKRVRDAASGSGQRELARLDLRELLGKLTSEEGGRRDLLGDRFGRTAGALPSPLTALAPMLNPAPAAGRPPAAAASQPVNINASAAIDGKAVANMVVELLMPRVERRLQELSRSAQIQGYANGVGRRV